MKKKLATLGFYVFCLFIFLELVLKAVFWFTPLYERLAKLEISPGLRIRWIHDYFKNETQNDLFYPFDVYDPVTGWSLKPGLRNCLYRIVHNQPKTVNSNSRGLRGLTEYPYEKPAKKRVVVLGDSMIFGEEVSDDETFVHQWNLLLEPGAEALNLGVHGYGHDQMLLKLKNEGLRYRPDFVILGFYFYDMSRNLLDFYAYAKPRYTVKNGKLVLKNVPVPSFKQTLFKEIFRSHLADLGTSLMETAQYRSGKRTEKYREITTLLLDEIKKAAEAAGAKLVLLYLPDRWELVFADYHTAAGEKFITEYASEHGVLLCNPKSYFKQNLRNYPDISFYTHYSPLVQKDLALFLDSFLKSQGLLGDQKPLPASDSRL